ncbi:late promoter transcription accessory protein [Saprospiraceae bacterium]|nr:late promoter transcription accessory protein [Saprospiraceae bacterium]
MSETEFLNKSKFSSMVEASAYDKNLSYMDAVIDVCGDTNIEPEDVKKFLNNVIVEKLEGEAMKLNYLPRQNVLLFDD